MQSRYEVMGVERVVPTMDSVYAGSNPSMDELLFFSEKPHQLSIYEALRGKLFELHPDIAVKVSKTQISFKNQYVFALVSLQRVPHAPNEYLLVSFGLSYEKCSPRITVSTESARNRWTHHVIVQSENEIDDELLSWIEEAYQFANGK